MSATGQFQFGYRRAPTRSAAKPGAPPSRHRRRRAGRHCRSRSGWRSAGMPSSLLDDQDRIGEGSRAICFSKRALEAWDRLGVADRMLEKGVVWQVGKVFHREDHDLPLRPAARGRPQDAGVHQPAAVLRRGLPGRPRSASLPRIDVRWRNRVVARRPAATTTSRIEIETPDGPYRLTCDWLVACDGARSPSAP